MGHSSRLSLALGTFIGAVFIVLILVGALRTPAPVQAQGTIIYVNTAADEWTGSCADTYCSLREAIAQANRTGGTEPVTITFADNYTITLTYNPGDGVRSLPSITRTAVHIIGDRNGDGIPDVVINGENLTRTGAMGLWIRADNVLVDGLEIRNVDCTGCWGLDIHGNNATVRNSRFVSNTTGILLTNGASGNLITNCLIAWNTDDGILVSASFITQPTTVITPAHHNTIVHSAILNNVNKGIIIQRGAHNNVVQGNLIAGNGCYGLHLRGGNNPSTDPFAPPHGNQILENTIQGNGARCAPQAAVVNDRTHQPPGDIPTLAGGYDNLFAGNVITANTGIGIYNVGASPLITGNTVANNTSYGIYNIPDFGDTYSPARADDDIVSIPILKNNTVQGNGTYAIYSLDTAPVDRYTLHTDNNLSQPNGLRVLQVWYGAVEVVTGTVASPVPITQGISARIVASGTGWLVDLPVYSPAPAYNSGIWGKSSIQYSDIRTWVGIREFEVTADGTLISYLTPTVQVYLQGIYTGAVRFSWDGLTATDPISGDVLIPQWVQTGPYGRYQVAEVNFTYDADQDTIPDVVEGSGDTDGDGQPDYLDTDSDNDGIPDSVEGGGDIDGDGQPNYADADSDGDGIPDWMEAGCTSPPTNNETCPQAGRDSDGDGFPDYRDPDDDGDGIPTANEYIASTDYFCTDTALDTDGDGTPNCRDNDVDGDGIPNYLDLDSDGDGTPDARENYPHPNPPPFGHGGVPAWIDPVYRLYLPIVLRNR